MPTSLPVCFCAACGVRLDVSLTDYGVREELANYEEYGFSTAPDADAYEINELLNAVSYQSDQDDADTIEQRQAIVAFAIRFLEQQVPA